jgi:hypothetical protein
MLTVLFMAAFTFCLEALSRSFNSFEHSKFELVSFAYALVTPVAEAHTGLTHDHGWVGGA